MIRSLVYTLSALIFSSGAYAHGMTGAQTTYDYFCRSASGSYEQGNEALGILQFDVGPSRYDYKPGHIDVAYAIKYTAEERAALTGEDKFSGGEGYLTYESTVDLSTDPSRSRYLENTKAGKPVVIINANGLGVLDTMVDLSQIKDAPARVRAMGIKRLHAEFSCARKVSF